MSEASAFTVQYDGMRNALISTVAIISGGNGFMGNALWDTGAQISCISPAVISCANPPIAGTTEINSINGTEKRKLYVVNILLPNNVLMRDVMVCDGDFSGKKNDIIIGMDVIGQGDFSVSNYHGKTTFSFRFPSIEETSYVKEEQNAK